MTVEIDRGVFPVRFLDLHLTEFAAWSMAAKPQRDFRLRWPRGSTGPETLRIGFEVEGRGSPRPVIRLVPASDDDRRTLERYMAAIGREDKEYVEDKLRRAAEGAAG